MKTQNIFNLIFIGIFNIFEGISLSLLTPFYSTEALSKGVSVTESGLVFGSVFITTVIATPICGKFLHVGGGARMFLLAGSFICAIGNISFGFLDEVKSKSLFLTLSFIIRIIIAIGAGAIGSSAYTLAAQQGSKENEGMLISATECCFGIGTTFGPSLGGFLYQVGGFSAPFWICGGVQLVISMAAVFLFKESAEHQYQDLDCRRIGWCEILRVPEVQISLLSLAMAGSSWTWYSASLAPFLSAEYGLSPSQCGFIYMIFGFCYTIFTLVFGFLLDRGLSGLVTMVVGNLIITVGFIFMGPIPQLEAISGHLWITGLSIGLQGAGTASTLVGSLVYMFKSTTEAGLPHTEQTQGMLSSLWLVATMLGMYVGSTLGGLAFDKIGFGWATLVEAAVMAGSVVVLAIVSGWRRCRKPV